VVGFTEHCNKRSCCIKGVEFLDELTVPSGVIQPVRPNRLLKFIGFAELGVHPPEMREREFLEIINYSILNVDIILYSLYLSVTGT
jgi:hypothetical protein